MTIRGGTKKKIPPPRFTDRARYDRLTVLFDLLPSDLGRLDQPSGVQRWLSANNERMGGPEMRKRRTTVVDVAKVHERRNRNDQRYVLRWDGVCVRGEGPSSKIGNIITLDDPGKSETRQPVQKYVTGPSPNLTRSNLSIAPLPTLSQARPTITLSTITRPIWSPAVSTRIPITARTPKSWSPLTNRGRGRRPPLG